MSLTKLQLALQNCIESILNEQAEYAQLLNATSTLGKLLSELLSESEQTAAHSDERTQTSYGVALAPAEAISCLADLWRTVKFLRGVHKAILDIQSRFPNEPINVVYAGCGPLATLVLPLCPLLDPARVQFTLIDIHQPSLSAAQAITQRLGYERFFREYICCDATTYEHPSDRALHLVISETMQSGLQREPQVAILHCLSHQLVEGGLIVPERISVQAVLDDPVRLLNSEQKTPAINLGEVVHIDLERLLLLRSETSELYRLAPVSLAFPDSIPDSFHLMLMTEVTVFGDIILGAAESGLTTPIVVGLDVPFSHIETLEFSYCCTGTPGFEIRTNAHELNNSKRPR